jgi:hypothetical protein
VGKHLTGTVQPGTDYKVKVTNRGNPSETDMNNGPFTLKTFSPVIQDMKKTPAVPPLTSSQPDAKSLSIKKKSPVRLIFPNGGEKLEAGRSYTIRWGW